MKYLYYFPLYFLVFFLACSSEVEETAEIERPYSPWIFRSVLDVQPRILTMALHDNLWVAYHTQTGALYKAWKGYVEFDGAVFTTAHGPQPLSVGDAYMVNEFKSPWYILQNGEEIQPKIQYRGHRFQAGHGELMYELSWGNGQKARIIERPEYLSDESELTTFERLFTTSEVPEGSQIGWKTNISSIALKNQIQSDGQFEITEEQTRKQDKITALDLKGKLLLKSNATTRFAVQFVKQPMIENLNKVKDEQDEERPDGYRLIARNDCKTCHNTYRKTIGPAYIDIAEKYQTNAENIAYLSHKVKNGGYGVWGAQVMSAHPELADEDIQLMVEYILSLDKDDAANAAAANEAPEAADYVFGVKNVAEKHLYPGLVAKLYTYKKN
ncbi:MAG: c-type cytochrome, partial [Bacteroidota bacterium]